MEGSKILISLNNEVIAKRISNILTESKYLPIVNNDGNKVMEMLRKQEINLVICGSELSGLGGMGVLKLKNKFIDTSNISFIMLIDQDDRDLMRECMELGADGMLLNPFKDVELLNQIETRLKKSSFATELYERKWLSAKASEREADAIEWLFDRIKNLPSRIFKKNQVIYHMDEKLNGIQLVLTGKVKTYISDDFGNSIITDIYREAQYFGIEGLYPDLSTHHMAVAIEQTELVSIPRHYILDILLQKPDLLTLALNQLWDTIMRHEHRLLDFAHSSVKKRVSNVLLHLSELDQDPKKSISICRKDIASFTGVASETLSRVLGNLAKDNLIQKKGDEIIIPIPENLARVKR